MVKQVVMNCSVMLNAVVKTRPSGALSDFTGSLMGIVRLVFGVVCFGGRMNGKPIPRRNFYQSPSLLDADMAPQNIPREKQLFSNPVQDLTSLDTSLEASTYETLSPLEQKQAIENESNTLQNSFCVSGKLDLLIQTNISTFEAQTSSVDKPKCLNELKLQQLKMD